MWGSPGRGCHRERRSAADLPLHEKKGSPLAREEGKGETHGHIGKRRDNGAFLEFEEQSDRALELVESDSAASPVLVAVVQELSRKAKRTHAKVTSEQYRDETGGHH